MQARGLIRSDIKMFVRGLQVLACSGTAVRLGQGDRKKEGQNKEVEEIEWMSGGGGMGWREAGSPLPLLNAGFPLVPSRLLWWGSIQGKSGCPQLMALPPVTTGC